MKFSVTVHGPVSAQIRGCFAALLGFSIWRMPDSGSITLYAIVGSIALTWQRHAAPPPLAEGFV